MTAVAPTLQAFFTERLGRERRASAHTVAAYRDALRLLLGFVHERTGKAPSALDWEDLDAEVISAFLEHLELERHNTARSRNARLAAVRALVSYASFRHPEHAGTFARVLAIPPKRHDTAAVTFLTTPELDALLAAPDRSNWIGRRDHALLVLAAQTGLRVSELVDLRCEDLQLGVAPSVTCRGKGRKTRTTPLTPAIARVVRAWVRERRGDPTEPLFPTSTGRPLSRGAVARRVALHVSSAAQRCPSLAAKRVSPHTLRHTNAMQLLHAGVDTSVIALWLGHAGVESTQAYLHADMTIKERALARTTPSNVKPGRFRASEPLIAFLEAL